MKSLLLLTIVLALGCVTPQPPPPKPVPDASDAAVGPVAISDSAVAPRPTGDRCTDAYNHLVSIGCTPAVADASTWIAACHNDRGHGLFDLRCIDNALMPVAAQLSCGVKCKR